MACLNLTVAFVWFILGILSVASRNEPKNLMNGEARLAWTIAAIAEFSLALTCFLDAMRYLV